MANKGKLELRRLMDRAGLNTTTMAELLLSELEGYRKTSLKRSYDIEMLHRFFENYQSMVIKAHKLSEYFEEAPEPRLKPHEHIGRKGKHHHEARGKN